MAQILKFGSSLRSPALNPKFNAPNKAMSNSKCDRSAFAAGVRRAPPQVTASAQAGASAPTAPVGTNPDLSDTLSLGNIRRSLILMEDTIIFSLVERAQFERNEAVYRPGGIPVPMYTRDGQQLSLLEYLLRETERIHGRIRRYTNPDETAFYPNELPPIILPPLEYPQASPRLRECCISCCPLLI